MLLASQEPTSLQPGLTLKMKHGSGSETSLPLKPAVPSSSQQQHQPPPMSSVFAYAAFVGGCEAEVIVRTSLAALQPSLLLIFHLSRSPLGPAASLRNTFISMPQASDTTECPISPAALSAVCESVMSWWRSDVNRGLTMEQADVIERFLGQQQQVKSPQQPLAHSSLEQCRSATPNPVVSSAEGETAAGGPAVEWACIDRQLKLVQEHSPAVPNKLVCVLDHR